MHVTFSFAFSSRYAKTLSFSSQDNAARINSYRHEFGVLLFLDTVYSIV